MFCKFTNSNVMKIRQGKIGHEETEFNLLFLTKQLSKVASWAREHLVSAVNNLSLDGNNVSDTGVRKMLAVH